MKISTIALAGLLGVASAAKLHAHGHLVHAQLHQKRGHPMPSIPVPDECVCGKSYFTVNYDHEQPSATPSPVKQEYPTAPAPSSAPPKETYSAVPAPKPESSNSTVPGYPGAGKQWAMTYSPYQGSSSSSSSCKGASQVMQDIGSIAAKGFSTIRIYSTDCGQLETVGAACKKYGLKMILGIFIKKAGICQDTYNQLNDIVAYFKGDYSMVEVLVVGNEAIHNGYCSGGQLASFISHCKQTLKGAGYHGMITTTDTVSTIQANAGALCPVIDCVGANMHPFFNGNVQPSGSGSFVASQVALLQAACPHKEVYNFECGWPTQGPNYMNAVPGPANQKTAIKSVMESDHCGHTVFFTMENDMWKSTGSPSVEPYWGCLNQFAD